MLDIASIFSSRARYQVIRTLYHQVAPLCLRHIAYLSETSLYSVQRVLHQLVDEGLLIRKKEGLQTLFSINRQNQFDTFLTHFFDLEMKSVIAASSTDYQKRAKSSLHFSCSALGVMKGARSWTLGISSKKSSRR